MKHHLLLIEDDEIRIDRVAVFLSGVNSECRLSVARSPEGAVRIIEEDPSIDAILSKKDEENERFLWLMSEALPVGYIEGNLNDQVFENLKIANSFRRRTKCALEVLGAPCKGEGSDWCKRCGVECKKLVYADLVKKSEAVDADGDFDQDA